MKMKKSRRLISMLMLLTVMVSAPVTSVHADSTVNRLGQGKVGSVTQAYTGGNSQVYAHLITRADGTKVRYVYSKNYLNSNGPEDTFAALKSVLTAEFAALIPDNTDESRNGNPGFFFCSDPSLEQYVNDNWTSAEYVARNILTVKKEGTSHTYKCEGEGAGGAVNTSATAARQNNRFERIKTLAEAGYHAQWEAIEEEKKKAWDAAEAEKKKANPSYTPQEYRPSTYTPLDFGDFTGNDVQGTKDITDSQIDLAVGCNMSTSYKFIERKLIEVSDITIIDHVATIYSDHVTISESSSDDKKDSPDEKKSSDEEEKTPDTYSVTVKTEGKGEAYASPKSGKTGKNVKLSAKADKGWKFVKWKVVSGDIKLDDPEDEDTSFAIKDSDVVVKAVFEKKDDNHDDDDDEPSEPSKPVATNPDTIGGFFMAGGQIVQNVLIGKMKQGPVAQALFDKTGKSGGWIEAFTFNMATDGKYEYTLKNGLFTIVIPKEYRKAGRTFALMGLDKNGVVIFLNDTDTNPDTLTVNLNIEGYAFDLIYKD